MDKVRPYIHITKYLWYTFLGLFSFGCICIIFGVIAFIAIIGFYSKDLPEYTQLKNYEPAIVTRLYAGNGKLMNEFAREKRVFTAINFIPEHVKHAFISAEDQNFYSHPGIDIVAITKAVVKNIQNIGSNRNLIGASTITQQVAKNFLLTNERKLSRKIREAILAIRMENILSKDQLLELYLNEIYLGARSYGVTAAALIYFQKSLEELTISEAAYLAALPKAPNNYHPTRKRDSAIKRRNWVIGRMAQDEHISIAQAELAKLDPLDTKIEEKATIVNSPYFGEEVRRELIERYGEKALYNDGLAVRTSIDPKLQDIAVKSLTDGLMAYDKRHGYRGAYKKFKTINNWRDTLKSLNAPEGLPSHWKMALTLKSGKKQATIGFTEGTQGKITLQNLQWARQSLNNGSDLGPNIQTVDQVLSVGDVIFVEPTEEDQNSYVLQQIPKVQGAIIALDPRNGRILAMQGGWKYDSSEFNRATQAYRQPGSSFKPFVYIAALDHGFTPATLVLDAPFVVEDRPGNVWKPSNYSGKYYGPTPIRIGVEKSKNLMTVRLASYLGMDVVADIANRFGIMDNMPQHLANSLGAGETTLLQITAAYGMLVNGGKKITPTFIDRIQDRHGKTIFRHDKRSCSDCGHLVKWENQDTPELPDTRTRIIDPRTAYQIVSILEGVIQRGTGVKIRSLGRPLAGKTGTTNLSKDAWFIGFSPELVVGVFVGFDDPKSLGKKETGSSVAVPIFKNFMKDALRNHPVTPFRIPRGIRNVQINATTGTRSQIGDENVIWEAFKVGTEPSDQIYILDGRGISPMPGLENYMNDEFGFYDSNTRFYTDEKQTNHDSYTTPMTSSLLENNFPITPKNKSSRTINQQDPSPSPNHTTQKKPRYTGGTGGLY